MRAEPALWEFLSGLVSRSHLILAACQRRDLRTCPQDDHRKIVDPVEAGDGAEAARWMEHHFDRIEAEPDLVEASATARPGLKDILIAPR